MVNVHFAPSDPSRCCLVIPKLKCTLSTSPITFHSHLSPSVEALIWLPNIRQGNTSSELSTLLSSLAASGIRLVQLPMTGADDFIPLIRSTAGRITWCCAKGCYAQPVAEHALSLVLGSIRGLSRSPTLNAQEVDTLIGKRILIVGGGGIGKAIQRLLVPFDCDIKMLDSTGTKDRLLSLLVDSEIVFLACPLTPATAYLFDSKAFGATRSDAILINVARGEIVDTHALIDALKNKKLKAAGLDVVSFKEGQEGEQEKQKLQELVKEGRAIVTPHSAIPHHLIAGLLGERLKHNLGVLTRNEGQEKLLGVVDPEKGY